MSFTFDSLNLLHVVTVINLYKLHDSEQNILIIFKVMFRSGAGVSVYHKRALAVLAGHWGSVQVPVSDGSRISLPTTPGIQYPL